MNITVRRKEVVHDDEVYFAAMRQLHSVQAIKSRYESVWILQDVLVIILEDPAKELVLGVRNGLDDKSVVSGEVEEGT